MTSNSAQYAVTIEPVSLDILVVGSDKNIGPLGRRVYYQTYDIQEGSNPSDRPFYALYNRQVY